MPNASTRRTFLKRMVSAAGAAALPIVPRRATAQTPVTVKYLTWWWAEKGRNEAWRGIVRKFHEAQKDIRVQEVGFPYSEFFQRVTTQGKIAQYIDNSANINILKSGNAAIYPKIFTAPPPWENRRTINIPNYVGIYAGSTQKPAAQAFLEFVFRAENFRELMEAALDIYEPYKGVAREAYMRELHWVEGFLAAKGTPIPALVEGLESNVAEVRQLVLSRVSEVLTAGKAPEAAMAEAQKALEDLAARV